MLAAHKFISRNGCCQTHHTLITDHLHTLYLLNFDLKSLIINLGCFPRDNEPYTHCLSAIFIILQFEVSIHKHSCEEPIRSTFSVIYNAMPTHISQKTSYLEVWLVFHPKPQLILTFFHRYKFELPAFFRSVHSGHG